MKFLIRLVINAAALWAATALLPDRIGYSGDLVSLLLIALVFGVLNAVVRPILNVLTCPLQALTLGLFTLVINAVMLLLTSSVANALGLHFFVNGFISAFLGALIISVVSIILTLVIRED